MMLENFRLRVFRAVAEHLNFRKAGEQLFLTQPAVTLQIKALEEELGVKLFERSASGVRLTAAGDTLLAFAGELSRLATSAEQAVAQLGGAAAGELVLGASTTAAQYVLPAMLAEFARRFPAVRLQVFSGNSEAIGEGVANGRFGLGIIEGPAMRRDLNVAPWFEDEMVIVVARGDEWAELGVIAAEKLLDRPLVMRERGSGSRQVVERSLQKAGLRLGQLQVAMQLDSTEAILSCVEAGLGIGIVSGWAVTERVRAGRLATLRLAEERIARDFSFVLRQEPGVNEWRWQ